MITNRGAFEYLQKLFGLEHFFQHVKQIGYPKVLDIGTGSGRAIKELSCSSVAAGIDFETTVLTSDPRTFENLPRNKVHITSAESLRGISNESVGGVIAVYSVGYSETPSLVAASINRVLAPSGVFKGIFASHPESRGGMTLELAHKFYEAFKRLGYNVATSGEMYSDGAERIGEVLLASKPDAQGQAARSINLLKEDYMDQRDQLDRTILEVRRTLATGHQGAMPTTPSS